MIADPPSHPPPADDFSHLPPPPPPPKGAPSRPQSYMSQSRVANRKASSALIWSVAGTLLCGFGTVVGLIYGIMALSEIKSTGEKGRGMAIAAIIVSSVILGWLVIIILGNVGSA
jgi:hypothetical protein